MTTKEIKEAKLKTAHSGCIICDQALILAATDRPRIAACVTCGAPYQVKPDTVVDSAVDSLFLPDWVDVTRRYWAAAKRHVAPLFACVAESPRSFARPQDDDLIKAWMRRNAKTLPKEYRTWAVNDDKRFK